MDKETFIDLYVGTGMPSQHYEMMSKDLDSVIQDEIEKRVNAITDEMITNRINRGLYHNNSMSEIVGVFELGISFAKSKLLNK